FTAQLPEVIVGVGGIVRYGCQPVGVRRIAVLIVGQGIPCTACTAQRFDIAMRIIGFYETWSTWLKLE
ncbi:hypothetical protein, partial [Sphingobacterium phlebotomi]|uniref:hypothetical protein n=1 Tax=Sphingobacterium phlebotomi TaxID=2605433 RepID=UPI0016538B0A